MHFSVEFNSRTRGELEKLARRRDQRSEGKKRARSQSHAPVTPPSSKSARSKSPCTPVFLDGNAAARFPAHPSVTLNLGSRREGLPAGIVGAVVDNVAHHGASLTRGLQSVATGARTVGVSLERCAEREGGECGTLSDDSARTTGRALVEAGVAVTVDVAMRLPQCRDLGFSVDSKKWLTLSRKFVEVSLFGVDEDDQQWSTLIRLHEMTTTTAPDLVKLLADTTDILAEYQQRLGLPKCDVIAAFKIPCLVYDAERLNTSSTGGLGVLWDTFRKSDHAAYVAQTGRDVALIPTVAKPCSDHEINTAEKHAFTNATKKFPKLQGLPDILRLHSLHCRYSTDQQAFQAVTGLGVCRVFASRYISRTTHGCAIFLCNDTYNLWHSLNASREDPEVVSRWEYLSDPIVLGFLHVLSVMMFTYYLPFMAMANQPQTLGSYQSSVQHTLTTLAKMMNSRDERISLFCHQATGVSWTGQLPDTDSDIRTCIPSVNNDRALHHLSAAWDLHFEEDMNTMEIIVLKALDGAIRQYDKDFIDVDPQKSLSMCLRATNRVGESAFATADNHVRATGPNISGVRLEAVTKMKKKPAGWLSDWIVAHPAVAQHLKAWGREWEARYPTVKYMIAQAAEAHRAAAAEAQRLSDNRELCRSVLEAAQQLRPSMRKHKTLDKESMTAFKAWWNKRNNTNPIGENSKKYMVDSAAKCLGIY